MTIFIDVLCSAGSQLICDRHIAFLQERIRLARHIIIGIWV